MREHGRAWNSGSRRYAADVTLLLLLFVELVFQPKAACMLIAIDLPCMQEGRLPALLGKGLTAENMWLT